MANEVFGPFTSDHQQMKFTMWSQQTLILRKSTTDEHKNPFTSIKRPPSNSDEIPRSIHEFDIHRGRDAKAKRKTKT